MQKISLHAQMFSASLETGSSAGQFGVGVKLATTGLKGVRGKN